MEKKKLESQFVKKVMSGASPQEIEEAEERWFEFLRILRGIVERLEREGRRHCCGKLLSVHEDEDQQDEAV